MMDYDYPRKIDAKIKCVKAFSHLPNNGRLSLNKMTHKKIECKIFYEPLIFLLCCCLWYCKLFERCQCKYHVYDQNYVDYHSQCILNKDWTWCTLKRLQLCCVMQCRRRIVFSILFRSQK